MAEEPVVVLPSTSNPSSSPNLPSETLPKSQVPAVSGGLPSFPNGDLQILPIMYPMLVPGLQDQEQRNRGSGLYAVPVHPFTGSATGFSSNTLIPLTYNVPTSRASPDVGTGGEQHGQEGQQQPQQQRQQQHPGPQRRVVVRRFQIQFRLDPVLILKLIALLLLFNQDGSRQKMLILVICASIVYLYKTGSLTPLIEWLSRAMDRAAVPPQPPRPAARAENVHPAARQGNDNAALPDGQPGVENENRPADANENAPEPGANGGNRWWGIVKEIQMIVFGFITSLLPGFHDIE
ncbi:hypothetical protein RchiOBHm_Chr4g0399711 [Rosa chinensis]|uniref:Uncharacterized protein n=1 Tax=Rosa chinensis TaxID=74649 RepID=A0A2P6QSM0_ROSCH|nr:uncharacterized protein LOC112200985 [Rosa chinensis]PRQ37182.1 hypothetical protein RchiOBHm_Chr4g0399711 [Rosa chinensis]